MIDRAPEEHISAFNLCLAGRTGPDRYAMFAALWERQCGGVVLQTCREATALLVACCPELVATCGQVVMTEPPDGDTRPWPHWWAVTEAGVVVDPTASQFPSPLEYRPADPSRGAPTGKCPNCAGLCYGHTYMCSEKCEAEYAAYLGL